MARQGSGQRWLTMFAFTLVAMLLLAGRASASDTVVWAEGSADYVYDSAIWKGSAAGGGAQQIPHKTKDPAVFPGCAALPLWDDPGVTCRLREPKLAPGGSYLAFITDAGDVYRSDLSGGSVKQLIAGAKTSQSAYCYSAYGTCAAERYSDLDISPDGRWIVGTHNTLAMDPYNYTGDGPKTVFLVRPDGSDLHQIVAFPGASIVSPRFSADGTRIYFLSHGDGNGGTMERSGVWSVDLNGGDLKLLNYQGYGGQYHWQFTVSPTRPIVLADSADYTSGLYELDLVNNTSVETVVPPVGWQYWHPDYSPDGTKVVLEQTGGDNIRQIVVMGADGSSRQVIRTTTNYTGDALPDFGKALGTPQLDQPNLNGGPNPDAPNVVHTCAEDPVDCATGNFYKTVTDVETAGRGMTLSRTYNSNVATASKAAGRFGHGWSWSFGDTLAIEAGTGHVTVRRGTGAEAVFLRKADGTYAAPGWSQATLVRAADGTYAYTTPTRQKLSFDATGRLTSTADRNGNAITIGYGTKGAITITDAGKRVTKLALNANGTVASATDPMGRVTAYTYDAAGRLTAVKDPALKTTTYAYDDRHRMTVITNPRGNKLTNGYDTKNRVVSQIDALGRETKWAYGYQQTTITDADGDVTEQVYENYQPIRITRAKGTADAETTTFEYDDQARLVSTTDAAGNTARFAYDAAGNVIRETDAEGRVTERTYDAMRNITSVTLPSGRRTAFTYDAKGNRTSETRSKPGTTATRTTTYTVDVYGQVTSFKDGLGRIVTYTYDTAGNRTSSVTAGGAKRTATFDALGRQLTEVGPRGYASGARATSFTTTYTRDVMGRVTSVADPTGKTSTVVYDAVGNVTETADRDGRKARTVYDVLDRPLEVYAPSGARTVMEYTAGGEVLSRSDGLARKTTYAYDHHGRPVAVTDPLARTTTFVYDKSGNLAKTTDPAGRETLHSYDKNDQLLSTVTSAGAPGAVSFTYDVDGNRKSMTDDSGTTSYEYDAFGALERVTNGAGQSTTYTYDAAGQQTSIGYPDGIEPAAAGSAATRVPTGTVKRGFDADGHLTSVTDWRGNVTRFAYGLAGELKSLTLPNGKVVTYTYDNRDLVTGITGPSGAATYVRSGEGKVTSRTVGTSTTTYAYDAGGRLASAGGATYAHDLGDQLTGLPIDGGAGTQAFDGGGQIASAKVTGGAETTFTFDQFGNRVTTLASGVTATHAYDQSGRLTAYDGPDRSAPGETVAMRYGYDGDGVRQSRTRNGTVTRQAWDRSGEMPLLLTDGTTAYLNGPNGRPFAQILASGTIRYLTSDVNGNVDAVTAADGTSVATYAYDGYGNRKRTGQAVDVPFGFNGQYTDAETGYQYLRARYYDPRTGQFLTPDPLAQLTWSPYGYANGDPINRADPSGLCGTGSVGEVLESITPWSDQNCAYQWAELAGIAEPIGDGLVFVWDNRGAFADIGATITCAVPTPAAVAACAYVAIGAFAVQAQQRISEHGDDPCDTTAGLVAGLAADVLTSLGPFALGDGVRRITAQHAAAGFKVTVTGQIALTAGGTVPNLILDATMIAHNQKSK